MTLPQLKKKKDYWSKVLNLDHWTIAVYWTDTTVEGSDETVGLNVFSAEEESSAVYIHPAQEDHEETLVHELLHLVFDGHKVDGDYEPMHERGLNRVARALVGLQRKSNGGKSGNKHGLPKVKNTSGKAGSKASKVDSTPSSPETV